MGNAFLNAQQMSAQLVVYVVLFIPLYHASRSFKFINTSPPQEQTFIFFKYKIFERIKPGFHRCNVQVIN